VKIKMKNTRKRYTLKDIGNAAALIVSIGLFTLLKNDIAPNNTTNNQIHQL
jgi:hypothetical protein